ncbi:MAG: hypothetical protein KME23_26245 [Goleter apudmare HA4340-LM2]|nr:hypothetical protein [Goleter apudmare HA4340-LM2]
MSVSLTLLGSITSQKQYVGKDGGCTTFGTVAETMMLNNSETNIAILFQL